MMYFIILYEEYLDGIINLILMCYVMIFVYNSGVGVVLKVFDYDKYEVIDCINEFLLDVVYCILIMVYLLV